jgi:hypothetical protein
MRGAAVSLWVVLFVSSVAACICTFVADGAFVAVAIGMLFLSACAISSVWWFYKGVALKSLKAHYVV